MERFHSVLSSVYRVLIVGLIIYLQLKGMTGGWTDGKVITLVALAFYGIGFAAVPHRKWGAYLEWLVVLGLIYYFGDIAMLYFLLVVPFIHLVSLKANQLDMILFSGMIGALYYVNSSSIMVAFSVGAGIYIASVLMHSKFKQIGVMERAVYQERKKNEEIRMDLAQKKTQIQIVTKLFIHKKHLEDIDHVELLVEQMVNSTSDFYDAYYVKLYYYRNGVYVPMTERGENRKYEVPEELTFEEGGQVAIQDQLLRVPMTYENQPWGCVEVYGKRSKLGENGQRLFFPFEDSDYEILSLYIDSVMTRMRELRKNEKLIKAAMYDNLTNLSNRYHLEIKFEELVQKSRDYRVPFTLLILDIDHFKRFNDDFGHLVGDEALSVVGRVLRDSVDEKNGDVIGRWGGEEFAAFIPGDEERGLYMAEHIRRNIEQFDFKYRNITVSIGGAMFGRDGTKLDDLYKKADVALYHSKEGGRNQVTFFEGGE